MSANSWFDNAMHVAAAQPDLSRRYAEIETIRARHHGSHSDEVFYSFVTASDVSLLLTEIDRLRLLILRLVLDNGQGEV